MKPAIKSLESGKSSSGNNIYHKSEDVKGPDDNGGIHILWKLCNYAFGVRENDRKIGVNRYRYQFRRQVIH